MCCDEIQFYFSLQFLVLFFFSRALRHLTLTHSFNSESAHVDAQPTCVFFPLVFLSSLCLLSLLGVFDFAWQAKSHRQMIAENYFFSVRVFPIFRVFVLCRLFCCVEFTWNATDRSTLLPVSWAFLVKLSKSRRKRMKSKSLVENVTISPFVRLFEANAKRIWNFQHFW